MLSTSNAKEMSIGRHDRRARSQVRAGKQKMAEASSQALFVLPRNVGLTKSNKMLFLKDANLIFDHLIMNGVNVSKRDLLMPDIARIITRPWEPGITQRRQRLMRESTRVQK